MTQNQHDYAALTLEEALIRFRQGNGLAEKYETFTPEAKAQYERHDMIHVLFGLDTSLEQETHADGWTLFGSDIGWGEIRDFFALEEEKDLIKEIGPLTIAREFFKSLPDLVRIAWRSRLLSKRWPWSDNDGYRSRKVADIRQEFGIPVAA